MRALRLSPVHAAWAELAATLVKTRPRSADPAEKLAGLEELERLLAACPEPAPAVGARDLEAMRALRPGLLEAFQAEAVDAFAAAVNPLLARGAAGWRMAAAADGDWALGPAAAQRPADWFGAPAASRSS